MNPMEIELVDGSVTGNLLHGTNSYYWKLGFYLPSVEPTNGIIPLNLFLQNAPKLLLGGSSNDRL